MIVIKKANKDNLENIFNWRNDSYTRKMFFNSKIITLDNHKKWFNKNLNSKKSHMYICENDKVAIAFVYLKLIQKNYFEISINVNPKYRGLGFSSKIISKTINLFSSLKINKKFNIVAKIKKNNPKSLRAFIRSGFKYKRKTINFYEYIYSNLDINFEKFNKKLHIEILYNLISKRKFNISNDKKISKKEHKEFCITHPYRAWYLVKKKEKYIGSIYITKLNNISINLNHQTKEYFEYCLNFLLNKYNPLKEINSIRPRYFYININPLNKHLISKIKNLGFKKIQVSFSLQKDL